MHHFKRNVCMSKKSASLVLKIISKFEFKELRIPIKDRTLRKVLEKVLFSSAKI